MMNQGSSSAATLSPPRLECRNPACFEWARGRTDGLKDCSSCGWQLAAVSADDVALRTPSGEWALADVQGVLGVGAELKIKAWATSLQVRARAHHGISDPSLPCECGDGLATGLHAASELDDGRCRYCDGTGTITIEIARQRCSMRTCDET